MPAKAGIQSRLHRRMPAYTGMTREDGSKDKRHQIVTWVPSSTTRLGGR